VSFALVCLFIFLGLASVCLGVVGQVIDSSFCTVPNLFGRLFFMCRLSSVPFVHTILGRNKNIYSRDRGTS
jgi:uncharacterized membrane protein YbaN (DUF454 family)